MKEIWFFIVGFIELLCLWGAFSPLLNGGTIAEVTGGVCAGVVALYLQHYRESLHVSIRFKPLEEIKNAFKKDSE